MHKDVARIVLQILQVFQVTGIGQGIQVDDPDIGIKWPFELIGGEENLIISEKDKKLMTLKDYIDLVNK